MGPCASRISERPGMGSPALGWRCWSTTGSKPASSAWKGAAARRLVSLSPQEHKLIRSMDQRNRANGQVPVLCPYEELLAAVWGEEPFHTEDEISHLVYELRQKLEPNPREPQVLQTVKGLGYRLVTRPLTS